MNHGNNVGHQTDQVAWTPIRKGPKGKAAELGKVGTLANVLGGDDIEVQAKSGKWYPATVAWPHRDGAATLRMNDGQKTEALRTMPATVPVKWIRIRPK